jgi:hypothetical protein
VLHVIFQLILIYLVVRIVWRLLSAGTRKGMTGGSARRVERYDTRGKSVSDIEYEDVEES